VSYFIGGKQWEPSKSYLETNICAHQGIKDYGYIRLFFGSANHICQGIVKMASELFVVTQVFVYQYSV
jgi:hypothetical protein